MAPRELPYREGDVFAVPLRDGGYGIGVVARVDGKGAVLGYFFDRRYESLPVAAACGRTRRSRRSLSSDFRRPRSRRGTWPVIGPLRDWRPEDWPMPAFGRHEELTGRYFRVEFSDDDPNNRPREAPISREEFERLPEDGAAGFGFIEARLSRLLAEREQ